MATTSHRTPSGLPDWVEPMLAKSDGGRLPSGSQWSYEDKLDGYRCCARIAADGTVALTSRRGLDFTDEFSELAGPLAQIFDGRPAILDGEVVAYNQHGRIDFELLQERRGRYQHHRRTLRRDEPFDEDGAVDVRFLAFDLLRTGRTNLQPSPYDERRDRLASLPMPDPYRVSIVRAIGYDQLRTERLTPDTLLRRTVDAGYEGLIAKVRSSAYQPGRRSDSWLKHPALTTREVLICGWRPGQHSLTGSMGGLLLGGHDPVTGDLVYLGDVGTGFSQAERGRLLSVLRPLERPTHPFAQAPPREDTVRAHWVEPLLVAEVVYRTFTRGAGRLRHTAWRGLREDRVPSEVLAPTATGPAPLQPQDTTEAELGERVVVRIQDKRLTLSHLDKMLYPAEGYTKGEVIDYYTRVAPVLLPHLRDRPVTFVRWPDGVTGQSWFGKNIPRGAPSWLRTVSLPSSGSRGSGETIEYPVLDDLPSLVWAANLAALELHVPQWTVSPDGTPRLPDRLVIDLDPGEGTSIVECCRVAERLYDILVADGLTPLAKTSGSKGMQLYAAIHTDRADAPSAYAKQLAQRLARETPDQVTAVMSKARRAGKVFIDWSQNNPAKTTIGPYSLRGREHPMVSTPVSWAEIASCRRAGQLSFTADDVLDRVSRLGDLFGGIDDTRAPLPHRR